MYFRFCVCFSFFLFIFFYFFLCSVAIQLIQCFLFRHDVLVEAVAGLLFFIRRILCKLGSPMIYLRFGNMYYDCSAIEPYSERYSDTITATYNWYDYFFLCFYLYFTSTHSALSLSLCGSLHCFSPSDEFQFFFSSVIKFGKNSCMNHPTNNHDILYTKYFWKDFKSHKETHKHTHTIHRAKRIAKQ